MVDCFKREKAIYGDDTGKMFSETRKRNLARSREIGKNDLKGIF